MKSRCRAGAVLAVFCLFPGSGARALSQAPSPTPSAEGKEKGVMRASGTFEVKLVPQADENADPTLGRMSIDKKYYGDLEGGSKGQMLTAMSGVKGSAGYVAIEKVAGKLQGRTGSFALQHSGTMTRGAPELTVTVVPDSGTDQLAGLAGKMTIRIEDGKHFYGLEYTIAGTP
jgi:Protein of unknown function (DUF3224)